MGAAFVVDGSCRQSLFFQSIWWWPMVSHSEIIGKGFCGTRCVARVLTGTIVGSASFRRLHPVGGEGAFRSFWSLCPLTQRTASLNCGMFFSKLHCAKIRARLPGGCC